jgi:hypothetical protein
MQLIPHVKKDAYSYVYKIIYANEFVTFIQNDCNSTLYLHFFNILH